MRFPLLLWMAFVPFQCVLSIPATGQDDDLTLLEQAASNSTPTEVSDAIRALARIKAPDIGFSPTLKGTIFPCVPQTIKVVAGVIQDPQLSRTVSHVSLVFHGPDALPELLQALDDSTKTRLVIRHENRVGGMRFAPTPFITEDPNPVARGFVNPENTKEMRALEVMQDSPNAIRQRSKRISQYNLTVGDLCYVMIGQIANRPYNAVYYQPSMNVYICSPVYDESLARVVREIWSSDAPKEMLFRSLVLDFRSQDLEVQVGAAVRLAYYYSSRSEDLLLKRIDSIRELEGDSRAENGHAARIIEALAYNPTRRIRERLVCLAKRTSVPAYFLAVVDHLDTETVGFAFSRGVEHLNALSSADSAVGHDAWMRDGVPLLVMLGQHFPTQAITLCNELADRESINVRVAVCRALGHRKWDGIESRDTRQVLLKLLIDKRQVPGNYIFSRRVCDEAGIALSRALPMFSFEIDASIKERDHRINGLKQRLQNHSVDKE